MQEMEIEVNEEETNRCFKKIPNEVIASSIAFIISLFFFILVRLILIGLPVYDPSNRFVHHYSTAHYDKLPSSSSSTVPYGFMLWGYIFWFLFLIIGLEWFFLKQQNSKWKLVIATFAAMESSCWTIVTTRIMKQYVGFLRPDFFFRCFDNEFNQGSNDQPIPCTNQVYMIVSARNKRHIYNILFVG